jgi:predicted lipid-binding transport protein (Tim44 family)
MTAAHPRPRAHTGYMSRMIWTILGAILALWLAFTAIGWMVAMLKTFFIIGLIAVVVVIVVWLLAGRARRDNAAR